MATQTQGKKAKPASAAKTATGRKQSKPAARKSNSGKKSQDRMQMIAESAYYRAESRGFICGSELQDWLEAESEIDLMLGKSL